VRGYVDALTELAGARAAGMIVLGWVLVIALTGAAVAFMIRAGRY
jgi:hypothetical protein